MEIQVGATMGLLTPLVADITAEGLSLVGEATAEELGLTETDATLRGPLSVSLDLMQADEMIAVTGVLEGTVVRQCVRCLNEYDDALRFRCTPLSPARARRRKPGCASRRLLSHAKDVQRRPRPKQRSRKKTKGTIAISIKGIMWS